MVISVSTLRHAFKPRSTSLTRKGIVDEEGGIGGEMPLGRASFSLPTKYDLMANWVAAGGPASASAC